MIDARTVSKGETDDATAQNGGQAIPTGVVGLGQQTSDSASDQASKGADDGPAENLMRNAAIIRRHLSSYRWG